MSPRLIRAVIVDDHPAMRAGVAAVLDRAADIMLVGEAEGPRELWPRPVGAVAQGASQPGAVGVPLLFHRRSLPRSAIHDTE